MKDHLVSPLSLSQLLKEKRVKQESMFYWLTGRKNDSVDLSNKGTVVYRSATDDEDNDNYGFYTQKRLDEYEKGGFGIYSAFTLSELPDVFRQVFPKPPEDSQMLANSIGKDFALFCYDYFKNPKSAWETLEHTIKELK